MGLFSFFKREKTNYDKASVVIGYFKVETSGLLGHPVGSKEYEAACASAAERIESVLLPALAVDKANQQAIVDVLSENCGIRFNEAFGSYLILLWTRFCAIQVAIAQGKVRSEEATIGILTHALLREIRRLVGTQNG